MMTVAADRFSITAARISFAVRTRTTFTPAGSVKLTGPDGLQQWILVAGLGGEIRTLTDDHELESILSSATPARRHAD